jgi:drug/metabolite transporter (DMT)-like permease
MSTRTTGYGILVALLSAATFATSGPVAKSLLETGWTPGSVVFLRILGAGLLLLVPTLRALRGRVHLLRRQWPSVVAYGVMAVAVPQLGFFYAVENLSVGVALLLEYLGLVLVVAWQSIAARRLPRPPTMLGIVLALAGLVLVLDLFGGVRISGVGVLWGLFAAVGLASYYLLSGHSDEQSLPPLALAGGGLLVGGVAFAVLGATGLLPMRFGSAPVELGGLTFPWWAAVVELAAIAGVAAYVAGIAAARRLGAKLASFVGLSEVLFAVLLAWLLLGELPRPVQLVGGVLILAGVVAVRSEEVGREASEAEPGPVLGTPSLGDLAELADERVEGAGVDVASTEPHGRVVAAVQDQRPL